jgi:pimeloyl-ACP methyl ester carboxylesterase
VTQLAYETVGDGDRIVLFAHGILGQGRNWRTIARKLVARSPELRALLVDLRNHGDSPPLPGPHDLSACAGDLQRIFGEVGEPAMVVGHSFGGKVVLRWALDVGTSAEVFVLDCPLSASRRREPTDPDDPRFVITVVREAPVPAPDRDVLRDFLRQHGIRETVVAWLLTSTRQDADGWRFVYDLDGVEQMMDSFDTTDLWPEVERTTVAVHLVRGLRSQVWSEEDRRHLASLPRGTVDLRELDAGHWLHVERPDEVLDLLRLPS